ncbi:MAG: hypothetical protein WCP97_08905 [bacterium]
MRNIVPDDINTNLIAKSLSSVQRESRSPSHLLLEAAKTTQALTLYTLMCRRLGGDRPRALTLDSNLQTHTVSLGTITTSLSIASELLRPTAQRQIIKSFDASVATAQQTINTSADLAYLRAPLEVPAETITPSFPNIDDLMMSKAIEATRAAQLLLVRLDVAQVSDASPLFSTTIGEAKIRLFNIATDIIDEAREQYPKHKANFVGSLAGSRGIFPPELILNLLTDYGRYVLPNVKEDYTPLEVFYSGAHQPSAQVNTIPPVQRVDQLPPTAVTTVAQQNGELPSPAALKKDPTDVSEDKRIFEKPLDPRLEAARDFGIQFIAAFEATVNGKEFKPDPVKTMNGEEVLIQVVELITSYKARGGANFFNYLVREPNAEPNKAFVAFYDEITKNGRHFAYTEKTGKTSMILRIPGERTGWVGLRDVTISERQDGRQVLLGWEGGTASNVSSEFRMDLAIPRCKSEEHSVTTQRGTEVIYKVAYEETGVTRKKSPQLENTLAVGASA